MRYDLTPCLFLASEAREAALFYEKAIPGSRILSQMDDPSDASPMAVSMEIDGHPLLLLNGNPEPAMSNSVCFMLNCDTQAEIDQLWNALSEGGQEIACGWLSDRFGVRWQIAPRKFPEWLGKGTPQQRERAFTAMRGMVKINIAEMEQAHQG